MTLNQAAESLGLSPATLRVQVRNGKLRATKTGRDWHVTPREVERYRAESLGKRAWTDHLGHATTSPRLVGDAMVRHCPTCDQDIVVTAHAVSSS